ncbi:heme o synthase [Streptomyces sp. NPDC056835]|uniref:heme o synthase n=1 Tax=Streptomyces sp. NPDC056835 TaxID=3345956 RepID=UPI00367D115B
MPSGETIRPAKDARLDKSAPSGSGFTADSDESGKSHTSVSGVIRAYADLCKLRIVELLLISAVPILFLAEQGIPSLLDAVIVIIGGTFAAGSANALNCFIDRDIDKLMNRTRERSLAQHRVTPHAALVFGVALGVLAVGLFAAFANLLAAALTLGAILYYVVIYTMWLKRRTSQSTFWGGICGSAPVLIAWATVTNSISWAAFLLFLVVFFWQPPHFWALAIKYKDDYARAGIPMLPVVAPMRRVLGESLVHSWLMVIASVAVWPLATTPLYGIGAIILGSAFLFEVHRLYAAERRGAEVRTMRLFHGSITYLTFLFLLVAVDGLVQ